MLKITVLCDVPGCNKVSLFDVKDSILDAFKALELAGWKYNATSNRHVCPSCLARARTQFL